MELAARVLAASGVHEAAIGEGAMSHGMEKRAVADALEQIASFMELKGENLFRVRTFQTVAKVVVRAPRHAAGGTGRRLARSAPRGSGPPRWRSSPNSPPPDGRALLEELRGQVPPGLVEMLSISGLGVAKIRQIHDDPRDRLAARTGSRLLGWSPGRPAPVWPEDGRQHPQEHRLPPPGQRLPPGPSRGRGGARPRRGARQGARRAARRRRRARCGAGTRWCAKSSWSWWPMSPPPTSSRG